MDITLYNMIIFLTIVIAFILWMGINASVYYLIEELDITDKFKFLDYQPWNCTKCATFWWNMGINITLLISTSAEFWIGNAVWAVLTILTAIAMHFWEKENTYDLSEIEKIIEENKNKE